MPLPIDLTGRRFGKLTVIRPLKKRDKFKRRLWLCRCDCGCEIAAPTGPLRSGDRTNCGCRRRRLVNLTGRRFGMLKVVRLLEERESRARLWLCQCDCGNSTSAQERRLQSGEKKSCGCHGQAVEAARTRRKEAERIFDKESGEWWYSLRAAARYLRRSKSTVQKWAGSCPFLDSASIEQRQFTCAERGQECTYYRKRSLDEVKRGMAAARPVPRYPGLTYIEDSARSLGVSISTLRRLLRRCGFKIENKPAKGNDGDAITRAYVRDEHMDAIRKEQARVAETISIAEAGQDLGLTYQAVHRLIEKGVLTPTASLTRKNGVRLSRAIIRALKEQREAQDCIRITGSTRLDDAAGLARRFSLNRDWMNELLTRWLRGGLIEPTAGTCVRPLGRSRRYFTKLYNIDRVAFLCTHARTKKQIRDLAESAVAAAPTSGAVSPAPTQTAPTSGTAVADQGGATERNEPARTAAKGGRPSRWGSIVGRMCYEGYVRGDKLCAIRDRIRRELGDAAAPKQDGHVTRNAQRYAEKRGFPCERPNPQETLEIRGSQTSQTPLGSS